MNLKKLVKGAYYTFKKERHTMVTSSLCGIPLQTYPGTIRKQTDQDDAWFFYLAKHHKIIFDIGANVGYTALLAMIQNPNRSYILVDPNPIALQKAQGNLLHNNLGFKANYYAGFVSNENDENVKFYTVGAGAAGSMYATHAETAATMNSFMNVTTVTLDFLSDYYGIQPDLVKIDVEGAETLALKGANKLAAEARCTFFVEMHNVENLTIEQATNWIIDWCKGHQYKTWYLKTGEELMSGEPLKNRGKCHLLLLPEDQPYFSYLKNVQQNAPLPSNLS